MRRTPGCPPRTGEGAHSVPKRIRPRGHGVGIEKTGHFHTFAPTNASIQSRRPCRGAFGFAAPRCILQRRDHVPTTGPVGPSKGRPERWPETAKPWKCRPRLDVPGGRALLCGVPDDGVGEPFPGRPRREPCQRSFNWQSTAFVMRGLRVRLPPLAVRKPDDIAGDSPPHGNSSPPRHP